MKEPLFCKGCIHSVVWSASGWECWRKYGQDTECVEGSQYTSKADAKLSQYPEGRREG